MNIQAITAATVQVLSTYLTYQAVRVVDEQLLSARSPEYRWFHEFSCNGVIKDGERYLQQLIAEKPALATRVMTVRAHLAQEVVDALPEQVKASIQQANLDHTRGHMERSLQMPSE